ncbi:MAG: substrate-binding domain-containing protein [Sedimentisphaerales bacterium]|nr:substrate-binding domain-containing protein [Sedimentisphaerales bacterium]
MSVLRTWSGLGLVILFTVLGCSRSPEEKTEGPLTLAVIPKGTTHEFWKAVHAGAKQAATELGVEIIWKGPLKEDDRESQIKVVEDFITRGVNGIVLAPLDDTALRTPVNDAINNGIDVVIFDSGLKSENYTSFVATDNYAAGRKAGEHMANLLGDKGKVMILRYMEGSASTMSREQGFLDAMGKYEGINIVSANQYGGATTESAYSASENLLAAQRDSEGKPAVDGIFCPNESTTFGMLRALQDGGLAGKVRFVGFDSSEKLIEAMEKGEIDALVLQDPFQMGYLAVKTLTAHLRREAVEKVIDTGSNVITAENMNEPEMQKLLRPVVE